MAWIAAVRRPKITFDNTPPHMMVCSKHFHKGKPAYEMLECDPDWAPSLYLGQIIRLQEENRKLKGELSKKALDENFLKDNDSKVKYYTGLPSFSLLMGVLMQIIPSLPKSKTKERKLSHFQMLLLTLMRLRLDLPVEHVAHLFDISRQTASNLFIETINVLHAHLSPLVYWPKRHCIQASMPHQYVEMFGNCATVIIPGFELFMERAQNLPAKAQTYSNYKSRHTMKYLISRVSTEITRNNLYQELFSQELFLPQTGCFLRLHRGLKYREGKQRATAPPSLRRTVISCATFIIRMEEIQTVLQLCIGLLTR
ncbi:hypothetical protein PO909_022820 [Leuciscus waleckii]